MARLHRRAAAFGLARHWRDADGEAQTVPDDTLALVLEALGDAGSSRAGPSLLTGWAGAPIRLRAKPGPAQLLLETGERREITAAPAPGGAEIPGIAAPGYHRLALGGAEITLAIAPRRAYSLADAGQNRQLWGLAVQLYALRRAHDGGIGDFAALADFGREAARRGAAAIALSPVHALFMAEPGRYAPYAPSSRIALNALHIAQDGADHPEPLIDWAAAGPRKLAALRRAFADGADHAALAAYRRQAGPDIEAHARFEALCARLGAGCDWRSWPEPYRRPEREAVARFAAENEEEVAFHAWLQYRAEAGLQAAQTACKNAGAGIGLISDLAVGASAAGAEAWSRQGEMLNGLEIGAPPDLFNREGQSWGITGFSPLGLRQSGFSGYIAMLRHALRHAGGVRIDHVMGLKRLWVVPAGHPPTAGAYLSMPFLDLLRLTILESWRHEAVILGEDLGTVPRGLRAALARAGIAGMKVLWFERDKTRFTRPQGWTPEAAAMTATHDLPTVAGWWMGEDIAWRKRLGRAGEGEAARAAERTALWAALRRSGAGAGAEPGAQSPAPVTLAAAAHLSRAGCRLALLPMEDALSLPDAPNLPGTTDEHPNWRRRLPFDAAALFARDDVAQRLAALRAARGGEG